MAAEHVAVPAHSGWATRADPAATGVAGRSPSVTPERPPTPVNETLIEVAAAMAPGKALDLGCGEGQNAVWLAQRGWIVNAADRSTEAVAEAREAAVAAGVERTVVFVVSDLADLRPASRYDLVFCTLSLPARGKGRGRLLDMAAAAVAPGGTILLSEFDVSLAREGWMEERYLVSTEELERHLDGFRLERSVVRATRYRHGYEERVLPVATVIATRRTDLRSF